MKRVAYLGMGIMGQGMAQNLLGAGYDVAVWNRTGEKCQPLVEAGAEQAGSPAEATRGVEAVFYCLADGDAVEAVVFGSGDEGESAGEESVLSVIEEGQVAVDMSTVHPEVSRREARAYAERGARFLSAPVFGSRQESAAGGLWVVAGGAEDALEAVRAPLEAMSASVHHMGTDPGAGASMKLVGNSLVASMFEALGEGLLLAKKAGVDPQDALAVIAETDFRSPLFDGVGQSMTGRDFSTDFALRHMLKDANLIMRLAEDTGTPAGATAHAREQLKAAVNQGWGEENASALVKALEQDAGTTLDGGDPPGGNAA